MNLLKHLLSTLLISGFICVGADAAFDSTKVQTFHHKGKKYEVEDMGGSYLVKAPGFQYLIRTADGTGQVTEKVIYQGKREIRFFNPLDGSFLNLEIKSSDKNGIQKILFYRTLDNTFKVLSRSFESHRTYHQTPVTSPKDVRNPFEGAELVCAAERRDVHLLQPAAEWFKNVNESIKIGILVENIEKNKLIDDSCDTDPKFKGRKLEIQRALAKIFQSYQNGTGSDYLACLGGHTLGLKSLSVDYINNFFRKRDGQNPLKISCKSEKAGDSDIGEYVSADNAIVLQSYPTGKDIENQLAATIFHEGIHACGLSHEGHVHSLEACCAPTSRYSLADSKKLGDPCVTARSASLAEAKSVAFLTSCSRYLPGSARTPGCDDQLKQLFSFANVDTKRELLANLFDAVGTIYGEGHKAYLACLTKNDTSGKKLSDEEILNTATQKSKDLCINDPKLMLPIEQKIDIELRKVCDNVFNDKVSTGRTNVSQAEKCVEQNQNGLKFFFEKNMSKVCHVVQPGIKGEKEEFCISAAIQEAARLLKDPAKPDELDISRSLQEIELARSVEQTNYSNAIWEELVRGPNVATSARDDSRFKEFQDLLNKYYPARGQTQADKADQIGRQAVLLYRYFKFMDIAHPSNELFQVSKKCKDDHPGNELEQNNCETKRQKGLNTVFFSSQCPSALDLPSAKAACLELGQAMENIWTARTADCMKKAASGEPGYDQGKGYLCYHEVMKVAANRYLDSRLPAKNKSATVIASPFTIDGKPFYDFTRKNRVGANERNLMDAVALSIVEKGLLGAIHTTLPGGSDFISSVLSQSNGMLGRNMLRQFFNFMRLGEDINGKGKAEDTRSYFLFKECEDKNKENSVELANCHKSAIDRFTRRTDAFVKDVCPTFFNINKEQLPDLNKDRCPTGDCTISPCTMFKDNLDAMMESAKNDCKLGDELSKTVGKIKPSYACIAATMQLAAKYWLDPKSNPLTGWPDMKRLVTRNPDPSIPTNDLTPNLVRPEMAPKLLTHFAGTEPETGLVGHVNQAPGDPKPARIVGPTAAPIANASLEGALALDQSSQILDKLDELGAASDASASLNNFVEKIYTPTAANANVIYETPPVTTVVKSKTNDLGGVGANDFGNSFVDNSIGSPFRMFDRVTTDSAFSNYPDYAERLKWQLQMARLPSSTLANGSNTGVRTPAGFPNSSNASYLPSGSSSGGNLAGIGAGAAPSSLPDLINNAFQGYEPQKSPSVLKHNEIEALKKFDILKAQLAAHSLKPDEIRDSMVVFPLGDVSDAFFGKLKRPDYILIAQKFPRVFNHWLEFAAATAQREGSEQPALFKAFQSELLQVYLMVKLPKGKMVTKPVVLAAGFKPKAELKREMLAAPARGTASVKDPEVTFKVLKND